MSSSVLAVDGSVTVSEAGQRQVHFVPATVEFNGRQDVAAYFTRFIEPDEAEGSPLSEGVVQIKSPSLLKAVRNSVT